METLWTESGWALPSEATLMRIGSRLLTAVVLGGIIGIERESTNRAAGLRTHMLVALGATVFTLVSVEAGATAGDLANVVKGLAAGIGFLGAGAILKSAAEREIRGLTTAASIWLTAAVGMAVGAGQAWLALMAILLSVGTLLLGRWESRSRILNPTRHDDADVTTRRSDDA
jgi:putative Mg2+ transporter-C (MgtC) family protein